MSRSVALLLVLFFLTASCIIVAEPAFSSADIVDDSWELKTPMHVARTSLGVAVVNGKIYAIGGSSDNGLVGTNEEYDPVTNTWTYKKAMPTPRAGFRFEVFQNKIYCIGGTIENGTSKVTEVYDPATDTWETRAPMLSARGSFTTIIFRNRIYCIGGTIASDSEEHRGTYTGATEVYDPATDTWETKASMANARFTEICAVINGKIYAISGSTTYAESISVTSVYDEDTDSWTNKKPMAVVKHGAGVVFADKIYSIGGSYEGDVFVTLLQIYDPLTDTWSRGALPPYGGVSQRSAVITTGDMAPTRIYVVDDILRIYDTKKDVWTLGPNMTINRDFMGITVLEDKIYTIGGLTSVFLGLDEPFGFDVTRYATNEVYTPVAYGMSDSLYELATTPPEISVLTPLNQTYADSSVSLVFTVNKPVKWTGYSLDGQDNVTIVGNTTLSGMSDGLHNVTVYAEDSFGNMGASETVSFSVEVPFPTTLVATASGILVAAISIGLLVYFKKHHHKLNNSR
jgi:N-acetylneuraminic acid mutarotase